MRLVRKIVPTAQTASLTWIFPWSTRNETAETRGAAHHLLHSLFYTNTTGSGSSGHLSNLALTRLCELNGIHVSAQRSRESLSLSLAYDGRTTSGDLVASLLGSLKEGGIHGPLPPHQWRDLVETVEADRVAAYGDPLVRLDDAIHRAAFRRSSLGRELYASPLGRLTPDVLFGFAQEGLQSQPGHLIAVNTGDSVNADDIVNGDALSKIPPAIYNGGGEVRIEENLPRNHLLLASKAPGMNDQIGYLTTRILLHLWSRSGVLGRQVQAWSFIHSDVGLVGLAVEEEPCGKLAGSLLTDAIRLIKEDHKGPSEEAMSKARKAVLLELATQAESPAGLVSLLTPQVIIDPPVSIIIISLDCCNWQGYSG